MTRYRFSVHAYPGDDFLSRGYLDGDQERLDEFTEAMRPYGIVVSGVVPDAYNPFDPGTFRFEERYKARVGEDLAAARLRDLEAKE